MGYVMGIFYTKRRRKEKAGLESADEEQRYRFDEKNGKKISDTLLVRQIERLANKLHQLGCRQILLRNLVYEVFADQGRWFHHRKRNEVLSFQIFNQWAGQRGRLTARHAELESKRARCGRALLIFRQKPGTGRVGWGFEIRDFRVETFLFLS